MLLMQNPTTTRAVSSIQFRMLANADMRFVIVSKTTRLAKMRRLSSPSATRITTGAKTAASSAGTEIIKPASPTEPQACRYRSHDPDRQHFGRHHRNVAGPTEPTASQSGFLLPLFFG